MSFYSINQSEMCEFLDGFSLMELPRTVELVYGKIFHISGHTISLRIYTAINPNGESRKIGTDCIRIQTYWKYCGEVVPVGIFQRCLRVPTWRKNLERAISLSISSIKSCKVCGSPMILRDGGVKDFWGCSTYFKTGCRGY
jgi:hypothetical protein